MKKRVLAPRTGGARARAGGNDDAESARQCQIVHRVRVRRIALARSSLRWWNRYGSSYPLTWRKESGFRRQKTGGVRKRESGFSRKQDSGFRNQGRPIKIVIWAVRVFPRLSVVDAVMMCVPFVSTLITEPPVPMRPSTLDVHTMRLVMSPSALSRAIAENITMLPAANVARSTGVWILTAGADTGAVVVVRLDAAVASTMPPSAVLSPLRVSAWVLVVVSDDARERVADVRSVDTIAVVPSLCGCLVIAALPVYDVSDDAGGVELATDRTTAAPV